VSAGEDAVGARVEAWIEGHERWRELLTALRRIMLSTELTEAIKWGTPAYLLGGKIVVGIAAFKKHCALWFHQGALLKDKQGLLVNAQEGRTRGMRQWRFEAGDKLNTRLVKSYVLEAIANQRAGRAVTPAKKSAATMPDELERALAGNARLVAAFGALTPGRQREYAEYVSGAKQAATRQRRLQKITPMTLKGVGLNDRYRNR